jgi:hypothetical protein
MAAIATITVFDGAATPVQHDLLAVSVTRQGGKITAQWREQVTTVPTEAQVWMSLSQETQKGGIVRTDAVIGVPVMESILNQNSAGYTAAPKLAYTDKNAWTNFAHPRSTVVSRRLAKQLMTNVSNNVTTSVAASSSGPFGQAVAQQLMPT